MAGEKRKLYLGPKVRRLRRERAMTQAQFAAALDISPSYVNLIERNQRPISAALLVRLAQTLDLDLADFSDDRTDDLFATLQRAFTDPVFAGAGLSREDAHELAAGNPTVGDAFALLYNAYRTAKADLDDAQAAGPRGAPDPVEEARGFIADHRNFFPPLDEAGEALAARLELPTRPAFEALADRLQRAHRLSVRVFPDDVMRGAYRRFDRHAGRIAISERLDQASRNFQLAHQLCLLEQQTALDRLVNEARFETDAGRRITRAALANYAAAALLLPYTAVFEAARSLRFDVEAMSRRFGASFEQICHRLATLQKPGAEGPPFFFLRVDAAGNISKRFSGGVFPFARYGGSCPLWNVHDAFRTPRRIVTQIVQLPDGARYFSIARTVSGGVGGFGAPSAERAVALGCDIAQAKQLVYADGLDLDAAPATPIGVTCRLCERPDCAARAHPPLKRRLVMDDHRRLAAPFSFAFD
ncbi:MAG: short-chain fatty acyl-CoA regulator family protein [Pseudomonadota bacterium]